MNGGEGMSTFVRFSYNQYQEMIRLGLFEPREEHRVELIYGEIVPIHGDSPMSPIDPDHINAVNELTAWSFEVLPRRAAVISVQNSIGLSALDSEPQPDLAWLVAKSYARIKASPTDVLLLIEVADSSLIRDRGVKSKLYARAGIRDYWIVDINHERIEVRRDPVGDTYQSVTTFKVGEQVHPLGFPDVSLAVARLFAD